MPDHCPHQRDGYCTTCRALDQALAELQRVRGQRDRLAGACQMAAAALYDLDSGDKAFHWRDGVYRPQWFLRTALADIAARP